MDGGGGEAPTVTGCPSAAALGKVKHRRIAGMETTSGPDGNVQGQR